MIGDVRSIVVVGDIQLPKITHDIDRYSDANCLTPIVTVGISCDEHICLGVRLSIELNAFALV